MNRDRLIPLAIFAVVVFLLLQGIASHVGPQPGGKWSWLFK